MNNTGRVCGLGPQCEPEIYDDSLDAATGTLQRLHLQDLQLAVDGLSSASVPFTGAYAGIPPDHWNDFPGSLHDSFAQDDMFEEGLFNPAPSPTDAFAQDVLAGTWDSYPHSSNGSVSDHSARQVDVPDVSFNFVEYPAAQIPEFINEDADPTFFIDQYVMAKTGLDDD